MYNMANIYRYALFKSVSMCDMYIRASEFFSHFDGHSPKDVRESCQLRSNSSNNSTDVSVYKSSGIVSYESETYIARRTYHFTCVIESDFGICVNEMIVSSVAESFFVVVVSA